MYGLPKDFDGSRLVGRFLLQICYGIGQVQLRFDGTLTIAVTSSLLFKALPHHSPEGLIFLASQLFNLPFSVFCIILL